MKAILLRVRGWKRKSVLFWAGIGCAVIAWLTALGGWGPSTREPIQGLAIAVISLALFKACELSDQA